MTGPAGYRRRDVALLQERSRALGLDRGAAELAGFLPLADPVYAALAAWAPGELAAEGGESGQGPAAPPPGGTAAALDGLVQLGLLEREAVGPEGPTFRVTALGEAVLLVESGRRRRRFDPPPMPTLEVLLRARRSVA